MAKRNALIILGMHRSGTSVLTALINRLGATLSRTLSPGAKDNPDGYFEPLALPALHDAFSGICGRRWHDPEPLPEGAFEGPEAERCTQSIIDLLREDFLDTQLFVVKDPRISRVVPLWIKALKTFDAKPHFVIAVRNPLEVALSLETRNTFSLAKSQLLWLGYMLDAERFTRSFPRIFCPFDRIFDDFTALAEDIALKLGIEWPIGKDFGHVLDAGVIKQNYRHHVLSLEETASHPDILPWSLSAYQALLNHIKTGAPKALDPLKSVFRAFSSSFPALTQLLKDNDQARTQVEALNQTLQVDYRSRLDEREQRISSLERRILELQDTLSQARSSGAALKNELGALAAREADLQRRAREQDQATRAQEKQTPLPALDELDNLKSRHRSLLAKVAELDELDAKNRELLARVAEMVELGSKDQARLEALARENADLKTELSREAHDRLAKMDTFAELLTQSQERLEAGKSHEAALNQENARLQQELESARGETSRVRETVVENLRALAESREILTRQVQFINTHAGRLENARSMWRNTHETLRSTLGAAYRESMRRAANGANAHLQALFAHGALFGGAGRDRAGISSDESLLAAYVRELPEGRAWAVTPLFEDWWYLECHPEAALSELTPLGHYLNAGAELGYEPSPLFDSGFYFSNLGLDAQPPCDALTHYCAIGAQQGESPHPLFDPGHYLAGNPAAAGSGLAPLAHYLLHGENHSPHPLFDVGHYLGQCGQDARIEEPLLRHYLTVGASEGLSPHPLFDPDHYLQHSPDVAESGVDPLLHYLIWGWREDRSPHPLFDPVHFRTQLGQAGPPESNPLIQYVSLPPLERPSAHPLFDPRYYLLHYADVAAAGYDPLLHYLRAGGFEGRNPHPLFDSVHYLRNNPDVAESVLNPLLHFLEFGGVEGRSPHPLFDAARYLSDNPDVAAANLNPLLHFLSNGWEEGRSPHPLFDPHYYLLRNPDVAEAGINPLRHFLEGGGLHGRSPHPLFDSGFYLAQCPDAVCRGLNPLLHWLQGDNQYQLSPNPDFDTPYYLSAHPELRDSRENPLVHYMRHGGAFATSPPKTRKPSHFIPGPGQLPGLNPLNVAVDPALSRTPRLNLLLPSLAMRHMSGGPNTAVNIGYHLAAQGVDVRFISTDAPMDSGPEAFHAHASVLSGLPRQERVTLADAYDRSVPLYIGENDLFFATAWWTAQMVKYALPLTRQKRFIYLIQDYEPILYPASSAYALAQETYDLDYVPLVNTHLLMEFLKSSQVGRFADPAFAAKAIIFDPAVSREAFHPQPPVSKERRKLLFYTRPTRGVRNLFEIGVTALRKAVAEGVFPPGEWEFIGMGEPFTPVPLGKGATLSPAPWLDFNAYAAQMREADILLSLMLSPHPSYPPLEMAACGKPCVTNTYATKDAAKLQALSSKLIAVPPTVEALASALAVAAEMPPGSAELALPSSWDEVMDAIMPPVLDALAELSGAPMGVPVPVRPGGQAPALAVLPGYEAWPSNPYDLYRRQRLAQRSGVRPTAPLPGLFSFMTTVWNTDPVYVAALASTVFNQEGDLDWEWVILDNGSNRPEVIELLQRLAQHPRVCLHRVETNAGIIGGMRLVLEKARHRYVLPLDSDDLLTPDCLRLLAERLERAGWPAICYTDEDKVLENTFRDPYFKPDFDPVLLFHSCYIAHLGAFDRKKALELGVYDDPKAEGCHDWDTFLRFYIAGHTPVHLDEVVYTWRMHHNSTAMNIDSKSYIHDSHRHVLNKFLQSRTSGYRFSLERSTLFKGSPDWRFVRGGQSLTPVASAVIGECAFGRQPLSGLPHRLVFLETLDFAQLEQLAAQCLRSGELVHLLDVAAAPRDRVWFTEAQGLMELFPDTVMVAGPLYAEGRVACAGMVFGLGDGLVSPDRGRVETDPGYFAQMWKPHSACAVPALHAVLDPGFLLMALRRLAGLEERPSLVCLGSWLGAIARQEGRRVVFTPFMKADLIQPRDTTPSLHQRHLFRLCHGELSRDSWLYASQLSHDLSRAYQPALPGEERSPTPPLEDYPEYRALAVQAACYRLHTSPAAPETIGILTTLYVRSNPELFEILAESLFNQSKPFDEWVLLAHGPIPDELDRYLDRIATDPRVAVHRIPENLGIQKGMDYCLQRAGSDYLVPMDCDDILDLKALELISRTLTAAGSPGLIYADENHLLDGAEINPICRGDFDPVLNTYVSLVWHPVAFRRETALRLKIYGDSGYDYCHDWRTLTAFAHAGESIVPLHAFLYHWRINTDSLSNSGEVNPRTVECVGNMFQQSISRSTHPQHLALGASVLEPNHPFGTIRRLHRDPLPLQALVHSAGPANMLRPYLHDGEWARVTQVSDAVPAGEALLDCLNACAVEHVLVANGQMSPRGNHWNWEAMGVFEMHPETAVLSARFLDATDTVLAGGETLGRMGDEFSPFAGLDRCLHHFYGISLVPQLCHRVHGEFFFARRSFLLDNLRWWRHARTQQELGLQISLAALAIKAPVVFVPSVDVYAHELDAAFFQQGLTLGELARKYGLGEKAFGSLMSARLYETSQSYKK